MGLAASQGRYLCLTARNSDLIYEGQQISQQRLELTKEAQQASDAYNSTMNNTVLQANTVEGGTQQLTYDILTSQDPYTGLCMRLVDTNGNVVIPADYIEATKTNEDGTESVTKYSSTSSFIKKFFPDAQGDELADLQTKTLSDLCEYYQSQNTESEYSLEYRDKYNSTIVNEGEHVVKDENCSDPTYLQQMLTSGEWLIQQATTSDEGWEDITWQGSTSISEVYYTADDAAAEAEYESITADIQKRDKVLELRLEQIETEQSAVQTELDSIKTVIDKNIEDTFKTFG
jgi:hypothetical protein